MTLDAAGRLQFEHFDGFCFFVADPLFLLWFVCGLRAAAGRKTARGPENAVIPFDDG